MTTPVYEFFFRDHATREHEPCPLSDKTVPYDTNVYLWPGLANAVCPSCGQTAVVYDAPIYSEEGPS